ncbi:MAG: glycosyltransferase [Ardenticatenaceae bacterium]|nr:glycosyltransferase [Ardenticatenaceae bacterium]MCB9443916.1 glycosyltransferase [Ardenticatenaceae bacterium]
MRIAHIIDSLGWGGAQKLLVTFAEAARQHDIALTIITLDNDYKDAPFTSELENLDVRIVTFHAQRLLDLPRFIKLTRFLAQEKFDIVHTHLNYANILGTLACTITKTSTVATLHNVREGIESKLRKKLELWIVKKLSGKIIVVGEQVAKARQPQFPGKILHVVPNAVESIPPLPKTERQALRTELTGNTARPLLISVGRLTPQKGVDDLLTAFAQVCRKHPQAALIIAGAGSIFDDLNTQIKSLGLENNAWLLGSRTDVPRLLGASDLFVSASHWEGLPVAMLEAMSAGLPVAATGVGDVPVVVTSCSGVVVPPHKPEQLAQAISDLLDKPEQLAVMGSAARERVNLHYSPSVWLNRLLALYDEVLSPGITALMEI